MPSAKLRWVSLVGVALIVGAAAFTAPRRASGAKPAPAAAKPDADKAEAPPPPAVDPVAKPAPAGAPVEVRCNIPPIKVEVVAPGAPAAAPETPAASKSRRGLKARGDGPLFDWSKIGHDLVLTLIFSLLGLVVALFGYFVYQWIVPFDLRKELEIDQNTSLGIVVGAIILGLCIIVAAAIASPS